MKLEKLVTVSGNVYSVLAWVSATMTSFLMFLSATDVLGRTLLNAPVEGTYEISEILLVFIVFTGSPMALRAGKFITMELIYSQLGDSGKRLCDFWTNIVSAVAFALLAWRTSEMAIYCYASQRLISGIMWPVYPFMLVVSVGCAIVAFEACLAAIMAYRGASLQ